MVGIVSLILRSDLGRQRQRPWILHASLLFPQADGRPTRFARAFFKFSKDFPANCNVWVEGNRCSCGKPGGMRVGSGGAYRSHGKRGKLTATGARRWMHDIRESREQCRI